MNCLVVRDRLPAPLLYLSSYFEKRRIAYYDALQGVRERGEFDLWLGLFLDGVKTQAKDADTRAERLTDLRERFRPGYKRRPEVPPTGSSTWPSSNPC